MNVVLIGAGRGSRLMPLTPSQPKSFTTVADRRILDWTLDAFRENGLDRFVFIGGYLKDVVRSAYPAFTMVENPDWADSNILHSLVCARDYLNQGFYATYTDTLFRGNAVRMLQEASHDIVLVMDTRWRERYKHRSQHPEQDGEKIIASGDLVNPLTVKIEAQGDLCLAGMSL